jgi:hypothetical protein
LSPAVAGGLLLALSSAIALNWGFLAQHGVASSLPALALRRPLRSLRLLFGSVRWLVGFAAGLGGWALYIVALRLAPLSLVQAVSAGGIGLLAFLVERTTGESLARRERLGVATAVVGLLLLGISLAGGSAGGHHAAWPLVAAWVGGSLAVAAVAVGPLAARLTAGAGFGVAAGVLYAGGDVATKAAVAGGASLAFVAAVLVCHGLAFVALQLGFQRGGALATAGVSSLLTNALPIVAGLTIFGESLPSGALGLLRVFAFGAVVVGAAALARPGDVIQPRSEAGAVRLVPKKPPEGGGAV